MPKKGEISNIKKGMNKMVKELTIKRTFEAPRELVFKAWTDPTLVSKWWGPTDFTTPVAEVDGRQDGKLYIVMHGPKGTDFDTDMPMRGIFTMFDPPKRIVFTNEALYDDQGRPQLVTMCTVTFTEAGSKTEMTLHITLEKSNPAAEAAWAGAEMGWNQSLDKLSEYLVRKHAAA
jgi:uncharacterized protein YndB with AHSA1/START domain